MDLFVSASVSGAVSGAAHHQWGSYSLVSVVGKKFALEPQLGDGGLFPPARAAFELNGALLHEIFWNVRGHA